MPTIYSVKAEHLIADAEGIEQSAKSNQKAWALLGQTDKYSQAMDTAYRLRAAAAEKNLHIRREILRNAGFTVKSPKQAGRNPDDEPRKVNPMKTEILERAKLPNGTLVRLQKRGNAYDVITNSTGITWRYLEKGVSEQRARNAFDLYTMQRKENPMKKPTPAQLAARARFAEMARSGAFKKKAAKARKAKANPAKKTVSQKISQLVHEGYPQKQAVAVALSEQRAGKVKRNPASGRKGSRTKLNPMKPVPGHGVYEVAVKRTATSKWSPVARFVSFSEAEDYSHYLAKRHPAWTIRVLDTRAM